MILGGELPYFKLVRLPAYCKEVDVGRFIAAPKGCRHAGSHDALCANSFNPELASMNVEGLNLGFRGLSEGGLCGKGATGPPPTTFPPSPL